MHSINPLEACLSQACGSAAELAGALRSQAGCPRAERPPSRPSGASGSAAEAPFAVKVLKHQSGVHRQELREARASTCWLPAARAQRLPRPAGAARSPSSAARRSCCLCCTSSACLQVQLLTCQGWQGRERAPGQGRRAGRSCGEPLSAAS